MNGRREERGGVYYDPMKGFKIIMLRLRFEFLALCDVNDLILLFSTTETLRPGKAGERSCITPVCGLRFFQIGRRRRLWDLRLLGKYHFISNGCNRNIITSHSP